MMVFTSLLSKFLGFRICLPVKKILMKHIIPQMRDFRERGNFKQLTLLDYTQIEISNDKNKPFR